MLLTHPFRSLPPPLCLSDLRCGTDLTIIISARGQLKEETTVLIVLPLKTKDMRFKLLFLILLSLPASLPAKDSPETLAWVQQLGVKIENTLQDAIVSNDWPNMLVKLMECHAEVDAITLHLEAAISPKSQVDSYFQLEQAYRIFIDLAHLTATLANCDATHSATSSGMNACLSAILSKTPEECRLHIQAVKKALERLKIEAIQCQ